MGSESQFLMTAVSVSFSKILNFLKCKQNFDPFTLFVAAMCRLGDPTKRFSLNLILSQQCNVHAFFAFQPENGNGIFNFITLAPQTDLSTFQNDTFVTSTQNNSRTRSRALGLGNAEPSRPHQLFISPGVCGGRKLSKFYPK